MQTIVPKMVEHFFLGQACMIEQSYGDVVSHDTWIVSVYRIAANLCRYWPQHYANTL